MQIPNIYYHITASHSGLKSRLMRIVGLEYSLCYSLKMKIAISGLDGSGKSTLCKNLKTYLNEKGFSVIVVSAWDQLSELTEVASKDHIQNYLIKLDGLSRILFILHSLQASLDKAEKSKNDFIIVDGSFEKYVLAEISRGLDFKIAMQVLDLFENTNEHMFYLDIPVDEAALRKNQVFSQYEALGYNGEDTFKKLHTLNQKLWQDFIDGKKSWISIPAHQSQTDVMNDILRHLNI